MLLILDRIQLLERKKKREQERREGVRGKRCGEEGEGRKGKGGGEEQSGFKRSKYNNKRQRRNTSSSSVILFTEKNIFKLLPSAWTWWWEAAWQVWAEVEMQDAGHNLRRSRVHFFTEEQIMMGGLGALAPGKARWMSQKVPWTRQPGR